MPHDEDFSLAFTLREGEPLKGFGHSVTQRNSCFHYIPPPVLLKADSLGVGEGKQEQRQGNQLGGHYHNAVERQQSLDLEGSSAGRQELGRFWIYFKTRDNRISGLMRYRMGEGKNGI